MKTKDPTRKTGVWGTRLLMVIAMCAEMCAMEARAAAQEKPLLSIDQECTSFSMAPDGRVVYSVRHVFSKKPLKYYMERDDIWIASRGSRRRIVEGEKLVRGTGPFSYQVRSLRWSPDGQRLVANLLTRTITDEDAPAQDRDMALLLDAEGREIKIGGGDSMIAGGSEATWLADGATVGFLREAMKPRLLFSINMVRPGDGATARVFGDTAYAAVAWLAKRNLAVAVERDEQLSKPPRLVLLDVVKQTRKELAELEEFSGGLSISPSGEKIAYYRDLETIEVREVAHPEKSKPVRALVGSYQWSADERRILLKPGAENKSNLLEWVTIEDGTTDPILHGLTYRDFQLAADGRQIAVRIPGKGNIEVFPLP
jgi:dipeptidyl aminopeptidase/acylaminoacyl peptidase